MKKRKKPVASSKFKGMKKCKVCDGHGHVRIVQGRKKGSKFERDIAKEISEWTGVEFKRTPMSGGWAKTGDITPKDPKAMVDFPFSIECKNQEVFSSAMLMDCIGKRKFNASIKSWWKQCTDDAKKAKKKPLLVMTRAREPVFLMMELKIYLRLKLNRAGLIGKFPKLRIVLWQDLMKLKYKDVAYEMGDW